MSDNTILDTIKDFIKEHVCPKIKFQVPYDDDITKYQIMHPNVFSNWLPPPNQLNDIEQQLPDDIKKAIPCITVGFDDGDDDGSEAGLNIRLNFIVYNPGTYYPEGDFCPNNNGYQDLINLIYRTRLEISSKMITAYKPFKWGMYQQQSMGYWVGWLTFRTPAEILNLVTNELL